MRALLVALSMLILAQPALAGGGGGWHFAYDSWSGTCYAQVRNGSTRVGFMARPFGPVQAFVSGVNLPDATHATWQVRGASWQQLLGGQDDPSGALVFRDVTPRLLAEVAAGNRLDVFVHATMLSGNHPLIGTEGLTLRGSAGALAQFQACICAKPVLW
jgi:hypothetical protein